ncbi:MAG: phosphate ABC transporter ATP-binding protein [Actinobacteria bacterium]|nr:phosphate ABC transporter ATP-binding protein [Actinomycetota bacterium]
MTTTIEEPVQFAGLETVGAHAWFGNHHALAGVSLKFPARSVTGLIGPSGCGKSTYLRLLNRMHEFIPGAAMAGEVRLHGSDIYAQGVDAASIRLKVGMVFQKPNPFPAMTIAENVLSGLKLAHIKIENPDDILERCLTQAGLWKEVKDRLGNAGGSLSGGQQQRLCIARSLAVEPEVKDLAQRITIVIVTHNMQQASRVSDYCAFFLTDGGPGYLVEADVTRKMFTSPKDERTADYVQGKFG